MGGKKKINTKKSMRKFRLQMKIQTAVSKEEAASAGSKKQYSGIESKVQNVY